MLKSTIALLTSGVLTLGCLTQVGCTHDNTTATVSKPAVAGDMTSDQMITKGNDMVQMGQRMRDQAAAMKDGDLNNGMSKAELAAKGEKMINEGLLLKQNGLDAKAHGQ